MERQWPGHGASLPRNESRRKLRRLCGSAARRFHENFLVPGGGQSRARPFGHLSRHGEKGGTRLRPLLVEQHSGGLWGEERAADQDYPRNFLKTRCSGEFVSRRDRSRGG